MSSSPVTPQGKPTSQHTTATSPVAVSRWARIHAYAVLWWLGLAVFVADQLSKAWIVHTLPYPTYGEPGAITVIENFFYIVHVGNTGAAWSLFAGQTTMLALLALATLGAIYFWRRALDLKKRVVQIGFGLLCGGIVGNLLDRAAHGHVIDFIDLHFGDYVYPTWNVADAGICVGVGIYLIYSLLFQQPPTETTAAESVAVDALRRERAKVLKTIQLESQSKQNAALGSAAESTNKNAATAAKTHSPSSN